MTCPYCSAEIDDRAKACANCGRDPVLLKPVADRLSLVEAQVDGIKRKLDEEFPPGAWKTAGWRYLGVLILVPAAVSYFLVKLGIWAAIQSIGIGFLLTYIGVIAVGFALGRRRVQLSLWIFLLILLSALIHF